MGMGVVPTPTNFNPDVSTSGIFQLAVLSSRRFPCLALDVTFCLTQSTNNCESKFTVKPAFLMSSFKIFPLKTVPKRGSSFCLFARCDEVTISARHCRALKKKTLWHFWRFMSISWRSEHRPESVAKCHCDARTRPFEENRARRHILGAFAGGGCSRQRRSELTGSGPILATRRINSQGPDWRKFSELCVLVFLQGNLKSQQHAPKILV